MKAKEIFEQSDGNVTKSYYALLEKLGPIGLIALNLFRAQKCSIRAKAYRKKTHIQDAYGRKQWSIDQLCDILLRYGSEVGITFGWKQDEKVILSNATSWVFYVDLPNGQVSFHSPVRGKGPEYHSDWDGRKGMSVVRVLQFCDQTTNICIQTTHSSTSQKPMKKVQVAPD